MPVRKQPTDPFRGVSRGSSTQDRQQKLANIANASSAQRQRGRSTDTPSARPSLKSPSTSTSSAASPLKKFVLQNLNYILCVCAVVAVASLVIIVLAPIIGGDISDELAEERYVSPYDWDNLDTTDHHFSYTVNGNVVSRLGVDVSENQHEIDWNAVAADGIDFAMIRLGYRGATEGALYLDSHFDENMQGALMAGVDRGIYFFSQARTPEEAREEADFVLQHLQGAHLEYPIAFDSEEKVVGVTHSRTHGLDVAQMTAIAEAFCERIEQAGYDTIIYGNKNDMARYKRSNMDKRSVWWAEYGVSAPTAKRDFVMWQYSNGGNVDGIVGDVDMNIDLTHALD